jgi:hypothetical protein
MAIFHRFLWDVLNWMRNEEIETLKKKFRPPINSGVLENVRSDSQFWVVHPNLSPASNCLQRNKEIEKML